MKRPCGGRLRAGVVREEGTPPVSATVADGLLLPNYQPFFRSGSAAKILIDSLPCGEVRSKRGQNRLFRQHDDGLASLGSCGRRYGGRFRAKSTSFDR